MSSLSDLYKRPMTLLTDLYELTMACGYWKSGRTEDEAVFHLFFREQPFQGGFSIACGLAYAMDYLNSLHFSSDDLDYLAGLEGADGKPLFDKGFLKYLAGMRFACDVDAAPEGAAVFPLEPLVRVRGPLIQAQLVETALLNMLNFQTLIATKAARICLAAQGDPVLDFGLRRAQGIDGGVTMSRAAYVGGCAGTSNVLGGKMFGIPVKGTVAHSWIMSFEDEAESFAAYADAMPNNCILLVDTYDSIEGVRKAIEVGRRLRERGHDLLGIRLDSGDLAGLSIEARRILDEAGFSKAAIVASGDLDEYRIADLKKRGAAIGAWGVGTRLATSWDCPAMGGVYKLAAVRKPGGEWRHTIKVSNDPEKATFPGIQQVRRFLGENGYLADAIYEAEHEPRGDWTVVDLADPSRRRTFSRETDSRDLLIPVFRAGRPVYESPSLETIRESVKEELTRLSPALKRLDSPEKYPVGLEKHLHEMKARLLERL